MTILQSCCFWQDVRKGSYASVIYTMIYFGCSCLILVKYISDEYGYLAGEVDKPTGESLLERGYISPTAVIFNILFLGCSFCLVVASLLVIFGLRNDRRVLLLPWIFFMFVDVLIEFSHLVYLSTVQTLIFDPLVGVLFTIDFFIMCLNTYCLLCVISQYQEYRRGRGYGRNHTSTQVIRGISNRDNAAVTTTCLNTFHQNHAIVSPYLYQHTNISTIPEEADKNHLDFDKDDSSSKGENFVDQQTTLRMKPTLIIPVIITDDSTIRSN